MRRSEVARRDTVVIGLTMAALAVTFGELMTGGIRATPFSLLGIFVIPPFVCVSLTYGFGALLVREASVRWNGGWAATLLLAAANAWVLQGVFTKVLFGPASSPTIGPLGTYGHWLGVNWVLAAVAIYKAGFLATVIPVFLVGELFPRARGRRLLSDLGVVAAVAVFVPLLVWEDLFINANNSILPSAAHPFVSALSPSDLVVWLVVVLGLAFVAWRLPAGVLRPRTPLPSGSPWAFVGVGLAFSLSGLAVEGLGRRFVPWPALLLAVFAAWSVGVLLFVRGRIGATANLPHRVALIVGALLPWAFVDVFLEADGDLLVLPIAVGVFLLLASLWSRGLRPEEALPPVSAPL